MLARNLARAAALPFALAAPSLHAQTTTPCILGELHSADAAPGDSLGWSSDVDGDVLVLGAHLDDDAGASTGAVYAWRQTESGAFAPTGKLKADDGAAGDELGISVATHSGRVLAGAPKEDPSSIQSAGSAYVFELLGPGWVQTEKLVASDAAALDEFGQAVALHDETAVVGAPFDDDFSSSAGSAYVFRRTAGGQWNQIIKLSASDGASNDFFGSSVAVGDGLIAIGSPADDDLGSSSGSVYMFELGPTGWQQETKLTAPDGATGDEFGRAVAIDGNRIAIGSPLDDDGGSSSGSAYVFERDALGLYVLQKKLKASDALAFDEFGRSIGAHGGLVVVGAPLEDGAASGAGAAYVYSESGGAWPEIARLAPESLLAGDDFGRSVGISAEAIVVGADGDDAGGSGAGGAYAYELLGPAALVACPRQLSLSAGGTQDLDLLAGSQYALDIYLLVGSTAGTAPPLVVDGISIPIVPDPYTVLTVGSPNQAPLIDTFGVLDSNGGASMKFRVVPGSNPVYAGLVLYHCAVALEVFPSPKVVFASNPTELELVL